MTDFYEVFLEDFSEKFLSKIGFEREVRRYVLCLCFILTAAAKRHHQTEDVWKVIFLLITLIVK